MTQGVEEAVTAFAGMGEAFTRAAGGWSRREGGAAAMVSRVPVAPLNAVIVTGAGGAATAAGWLDEIVAEGLPHCLQTRPGDTEAEDLARSRGMTAGELVPFMLAGTRMAPPASPAVRELAPDELDLHIDTMRDGFGMPEAVVGSLRGTPLLHDERVRAYVVEEGSGVVATSLGVVHEGHVGVFNVTTLPAARGRGYGAALTARVVADSASAGARAASLQSSALAVPVYERLGFVTAEHWTVWTA